MSKLTTIFARLGKTVSENNKQEKRMLTECAKEGFRLLDAHLQRNFTERFSPVPFIPGSGILADRLEERLYSNHPDVFYSFLSVLYATDDEPLVKKLISRKDVKGDMERSLDFIEGALYSESQFERELGQSIHRHMLFSDDEIRKEFSARFEVSPMSLMELPTDRSVYLAKVNHGYWEYVRGAYDDAHGERDQFRDINIALRRRRLRTSGVTQFWGRQIHRHITPGYTPSADKHVSLCVNLTAGTEPPARSIRKELNPITRGAAIGLMSMFETALPGLPHFHVGDGRATRGLLIDKTLEAFFEKYIDDSDACLFVVPPHLKQIDFVNYKGSAYKFLVPPTRVNETWKAVAATLLGYLVRLSKKHQTITILGQGASIASLISLLFSDVDAIPQVRLRYFDLGRVLDVATPEFMQKQAWAMRHFDEYVTEGGKVFRTVADADCILASMF
jgi:hypothetical protein